MSTLLRWFVHLRGRLKISILIGLKVCALAQKVGYVHGLKHESVMLSCLLSQLAG